MPLSDVAARSAKPSAKSYKLADEKGLYLLVMPNGAKYWRHKYRFDGKEKLASYGCYPEVSLKDARVKRDEARRLLDNDVDPGANKKAKKAARLDRAANSFEVVAREWFNKYSPGWAKSHADKIIARLERDVFPWLGGRPIAEISAPEILAVLRRIEQRGALDTAHRAKQNCGQVFRYAIATGRAERDPSFDLRGALPPAKEGHFAAITEPAKLGELLRAFDAFGGTFVVLSALRLLPLVFVRPGELRCALWEHVDLENAVWRYVTSKTQTEHLVPLATQAVAILSELKALTGHGKYVFPGRDPQRPMSDGAINAALRRLGFDTQAEVTAHGFRATARTVLHEVLHQKPEVIEHQLAHKVPDALGASYNRTKFIVERTAMMQLWADYLDRLKVGEVDSSNLVR